MNDTSLNSLCVIAAFSSRQPAAASSKMLQLKLSPEQSFQKILPARTTIPSNPRFVGARPASGADAARLSLAYRQRLLLSWNLSSLNPNSRSPGAAGSSFSLASVLGKFDRNQPPRASIGRSDFGGHFPSEVDTRSFCRASKKSKVRAKLAKSAKCAAIMIFFRQNRVVV